MTIGESNEPDPAKRRKGMLWMLGVRIERTGESDDRKAARYVQTNDDGVEQKPDAYGMAKGYASRGFWEEESVKMKENGSRV